MKKRKTVQEPVEIDVLQKKKDELAQFVERYNSAVAVVTGTVSNLESINASIDEKIKEIEECQEELVKTKNGLGDTKMKNEQVIKNFKALVGA